MPLNLDSLLNSLRQDFCLALKAARERKGITLEEIADTTKIPASLFAGLEHGDLRRWPKGIFRRSFFRDYVRTIGLPAAELCAEFVRLFPDDERAAAAATGAHQPDELRLALDVAWRGPRASVRSRLLIALIDAGAVILVATALWWRASMGWPATTAIVALAYFSLSTAIIGESPAKWTMSKRRSILQALTQGMSRVTGAIGRGDSGVEGWSRRDLAVIRARRRRHA
jgi:transcriptional regulator with XRE-family HTH domain